MALRQRKHRNIPQDSADIMMRIIARPGRIAQHFSVFIPGAGIAALDVRNTDNQPDVLFPGINQICNIAVPCRKAAQMRPRIVSVYPDSAMGIHALKLQKNPLSRKIFWNLHLSAVVIFHIVFDIKALHCKRRWYRYRLPVCSLFLRKIKILLLCKRRRDFQNRLR